MMEQKARLVKKEDIINKQKVKITSNAEARRVRGDEGQELRDLQASIERKFKSKPAPDARTSFAALFSKPK